MFVSNLLLYFLPQRTQRDAKAQKIPVKLKFKSFVFLCVLCVLKIVCVAAPAIFLVKKSFAQDRQIPGKEKPDFPFSIYESIPEAESSTEFSPVLDRWRQFYEGRWYDPYNQNVLKGDIPIFGSPGHEWFFELNVNSDSAYEYRRLPIPVGGASTNNPGRINTFGDGDQHFFNETLFTSFALIRGNTSFKPPEFEFRVAPAFSGNFVNLEETGGVRANPDRGDSRNDSHLGFQELFADIHLANLSERYDFISSRVGIQKFISDFRGFIYSDEAPGIRFFGNLDNNKWQFNLAWFSRLDKDTNSGLNEVFDSRHEEVIIANLFRQDALFLGHTIQGSIVYRSDTAGEEGLDYDNNGFLVRPAPIGDEFSKNVYSTYFGFTADGHIERINTTTAIYYVTGSESHNQIAQRQTDISAGMFAQEFSYDIDWIRLRGSLMWASGDNDPRDGTATGFDSVIDSPNFAGGDIGFWQRQGIPLIGGGGVNLVNRMSLYPDLKPGKEEGQSNFVNPGLRLYNLGVDFDLTPKLKLINNISFLQFDSTEVLKTVRQDGSINQDIGYDISSGILYRPFLNNNVQFRLGAAALIPDTGVENLFGDAVLLSVFGNVILQY